MIRQMTKLLHVAAATCGLAIVLADAQSPRSATDARSDEPAVMGLAPGEWVKTAFGSAEHSLLVSGYNFTHPSLVPWIRDAIDRGVKVELLLDRATNADPDRTIADELPEAVVTYLDGKHRIMHSKTIVVDGAVVVTGSFNPTKSGDRSNAENSLATARTRCESPTGRRIDE